MHLQKWSASNGNHTKKKEAITKRLRVGGPSIGAPFVVARASAPRVMFVPPRASSQSDKEVEIMAALIAVAWVAPLVVLAHEVPMSAPWRVLTSPGESVAPLSYCSRGGKKAPQHQEIPGPPLVLRGARTSRRSLRHCTIISQARDEDGWVYQVHVDEADSALHNSLVSQELS